jgi:hypothetical protein
MLHKVISILSSERQANMKLFLSTLLIFFVLPIPSPSQTSASTNALLERRPFIQIPGPDPIIIRGGKGAWDEGYIEAAEVLKDFETYYLYYHGAPVDMQRWGRPGYRIGVATAPHPLGPWTKYGDKPILELGPPGSWDDAGVACASILKEGPGKYFMWYCGIGTSGSDRKWSTGLAVAARPEGPWKKYEQNPVIKDFGYVGNVFKWKGKYYLYSEYPIGSTAPDYGPVALATADSPEGPWTLWKGNPVLPASDLGAWDDGGTSGPGMLFLEGVFHMFYGGAKEDKPRRRTRESIGYAYSFDGFHFIKYGGNPVASRDAEPNAASFSEVHCLYEPPFIYIYNTIRYLDPTKAPLANDAINAAEIEDLGVQILATERPFRLAMPLLSRESLPARSRTQLSDCPAVSLDGVSQVSLTVECRYAPGAQAGMRFHVRSSADGTAYDTTDLFTFENDFRPGDVGRKTVELKAGARFIKVLLENMDSEHNLSGVRITVTLGD